MNKPAELTKRVKDYALEKGGFDLVGIALASDPQFARAPKGHHPNDWLPGAKSVIVVGLRVIREILVTTPSPLFSKHYDQLNAWLNEGAYRLTKGLKDMGFKAIYFPETEPYACMDRQPNHGEPRWNPSFCHIHSAVAAGLGRRGKVGVVLTPQYGPRQRWITVVTSAQLLPDRKMDRELCMEFIEPGSCGDRCIEACRTKRAGALKAWPDEGGVHMYKCDWRDLKAGGLSCGMCIAVCPVGKE
jgi:O-acetylhomoserine (thiol)-lyase